jgi:hypothetical protein
MRCGAVSDATRSTLTSWKRVQHAHILADGITRPKTRSQQRVLVCVLVGTMLMSSAASWTPGSGGFMWTFDRAAQGITGRHAARSRGRGSDVVINRCFRFDTRTPIR